MKVRPHDRRGHAKQLRECAPGPVRVTGGAQILAPAAAILAEAARARDSRNHALANPEIADALPYLDDLATGFVPHRDGQRDPRVPAREELDVGPANDGRAHAENDLARPRPRRRQIALLVCSDRGLDKGPHGIEDCRLSIED